MRKIRPPIPRRQRNVLARKGQGRGRGGPDLQRPVSGGSGRFPTWLATAGGPRPRPGSSAARPPPPPVNVQVSLRRPADDRSVRLRLRWRYAISRVVAPTQTTSTPDASGSSVPACPTLTLRKTPRHPPTTSRGRSRRLVKIQDPAAEPTLPSSHPPRNAMRLAVVAHPDVVRGCARSALIWCL